ncbi:MAG: phosphoglycolate phosphatase [Rubrivivax sp.]|nr:phosphoglycolate phosphatase [Rubrivivax sp.]
MTSFDASLRGVRAAIIDLDGTLVDTVGDFEAALGATLAELGRPAVTREFIGRTVGKGTEHLIARTLAEVGAPPALFEHAFGLYQQHYRRINGRHSEVFEGAREGLAGLRARGWPLVCLTNKPGAFAAPLLEAKGLRPFFAHVFGGDAFARKKPDPLPLVQACRALGTEPHQTLMVGDSSNDAAAARAAGCPVVLLSHGYNHGEPVEAAGADAVLDRLDELLPLLETAAG